MAARISVLIPCHEYGAFVADAIASLDAQERRPDEIIICDDGSSATSWNALVAAVAGRDDITTCRHYQPHGLVATFNELVDRATGDVIVKLDADDRLSPSYLRRMEEALDRHNWDFGYSDLELFGVERGTVAAPAFDRGLLLRRNFISGSAAFRRSVFDRVGGYAPAFEAVGHEDWNFWLAAVEHGAVGGKVEGCAVEWRRHAAGSRNTTTLPARARLRWLLLRHHARMFLSPAGVHALAGAAFGALRP